MIRFVTASALALASTTPSFAADFFAPAQSPVSPVAMHVWSGGYIGANFGYAWGDASATALGITASDDYDGWLAGVQSGYNWQSGNIVSGIELDFQGTDIGEKVTEPGVGSASTELHWLATARARIGYAFGNIMPYVTGGFAAAENEIEFTVFGAGSAADSKMHLGWTAGGGIEALLSPRWSVKGEYLFVDLGEETYFPAALGGIEADGNFHIARIGLNYRFP